MAIRHDVMQEWIGNYVKRCGGPQRTRGKCMDAAQEMASVFPQLRVEKGHVESANGREAHWWCVDTDGSIVDPTRGQFHGVVEYEAFQEGDEVRLGRCMECGDEIWGQPSRGLQCICSDACAIAFDS